MLQDLLHAIGLKMTEHSCEGLLCPIPRTNHQRALLHRQTPQLVLEIAISQNLQCRGGWRGVEFGELDRCKCF